MVEGDRPTAPPAESSSSDDDPFGALPPGTIIGKYELLEMLGQGGFGVTYRARDAQLRRDVAVKEYLPTSFAVRRGGATVLPRSTHTAEDFLWGRERFLEEARTLATLEEASGIVSVYDFMEANGTAYMVMGLVRGETVEARLKRDRRLQQPAIEQLLYPLLDGLELVHEAGFLHRDIKPANILLDASGRPTLIDFGASRLALQGRTQVLTAIFTPGYAAFEQSTSARQGPWTDIYALAATLYHCITGAPPPSASDRVIDDDLLPAVEAGKGRYAPSLLAAIDAGLQLKAADRPQSIAAWRRVLSGTAAESVGAVTREMGESATRRIDPLVTRRTEGPTSSAVAAGRRRFRPAWALAGIVALIVAGGSTWLVLADTARRNEAETQRQAAVALKQREDEEARQRAAVEARRTAEAEAVRKAAEEKAAVEAAARKAVEEKAAAEEAVRRKADEEIAAQAARRRAEEQARAEAETRRKAEEDSRRAAAERARAEAVAREKAEAEMRARVEAEIRHKVEEEARLAAEEKARVEAEARRQAEEKARLEAEARRQVEEKARAEADARQRAEAAEAALRLSETDRKRIQVALTSLGHDTHGSDGSFGARTRQMIAGWQKGRGVPETGYLTAVELTALHQQAAPALARYDQELKRLDDEKRKAEDDARRKLDEEAKRRAEEEKRRHAQAPPAAPPSVAAVPPPAARTSVDGSYSGEHCSGGKRAVCRQTSIVVQNGAASYTWPISRCGADKVGTMTFRIDAAGGVAGTWSGMNDSCAVTSGRASGQYAGGVISIDNGANIHASFTRK